MFLYERMRQFAIGTSFRLEEDFRSFLILNTVLFLLFLFLFLLSLLMQLLISFPDISVAQVLSHLQAIPIYYCILFWRIAVFLISRLRGIIHSETIYDLLKSFINAIVVK